MMPAMTQLSSFFEALYFQWPYAFWLLLLLPIWFWVYRQAMAKQLDRAYQFSPLVLLEQLAPGTASVYASTFKRFFAPLSALGLILILILALARPTITAEVPLRQVNMMLVMDISLSMMADDIQPSRMESAKEAAIQFVESLPEDVRIGLELFAGNNFVVQEPSREHQRVIAYLRSLSNEHLQMRTEIGSAIKTATTLLTADSGEQDRNTASLSKQPKPKRPDQIIVLLSDGDSQEGYPWSLAASEARSQNITIHTVGIGSEGPASIIYQQREYPVKFSEKTLRQIAELTKGQYFRVFTASDFKAVYEQVRERSVVMERQTQELTVWLVLLALAWHLVASLLELFWVKRF